MNTRFPAFAATLMLCMAIPGLGCEKQPAASAAPTASIGHVTPAGIERVDPIKVCMVNNHFMGKDQIPVQVGATTYFGCCEMCKTKLAQDPTSRVDTDPVSGRQVDKAKAVIGKRPDGSVVYFESEANLLAYQNKS